MEVEELGLPHPRHVRAGGGGLPAVGQDQSSYNRFFLPNTTNQLFLSGRGDYCD